MYVLNIYYRLLSEFLSVKTEMDSVLRETEVLEAELDVLLNKVEKRRSRRGFMYT